MRGVDIALQRLQIIAVALYEGRSDLGVGNAQNLECRQRRRLRPRSHIDPHEPGTLDRAVRFGADLVLEILMRRHIGHVDTSAGRIEFPAVIDAADATLLVAAEEQRRAAVRAPMIHDPDAPRAVAKGDELLAEQHQAKRRPVALEFRGQQRGQPVLPHQLAHDGAGPDAREFDAFDRRCHPILNRLAGSLWSDAPSGLGYVAGAAATRSTAAGWRCADGGTERVSAAAASPLDRPNPRTSPPSGPGLRARSGPAGARSVRVASSPHRSGESTTSSARARRRKCRSAASRRNWAKPWGHGWWCARSSRGPSLPRDRPGRGGWRQRCCCGRDALRRWQSRDDRGGAAAPG